MVRVARYLAPLVLMVAFARCRDQAPDVTPSVISITPASAATLVSGATLTLTASVANAAGDALTGLAVEWISTDPSVATVSSAGLVTGIRAGEAQISASVGSMQSTAVTVTVTPGPASRLGVRRQPASGASGAPLATQPIVEIQDAAGNVVTSSTATVTAIIATGGGAITGSTAVAVDGVATFTALAISGPIGDRTLLFSAPDLASVSSSGFVVDAGAPSQLAIRTEPTSAASGAPFGVQPVVEIRDDADNVVTTSTAVVTAAVRSGGGTLANVTVNAVNGVAAFSNLALSGVIGTRTLSFGSPGLREAVSRAFSLVAGRPAALRVRRQPGGAVSGQAFAIQPIVEVTDDGGNPVSSSVAVTASLTNGEGGTLTGGSATAVDGVATFTALTLTGVAGVRSLTFSAQGLTSTTSAPFTLASGTPAVIRIRVQPALAPVGAPLTVQPVIAIEDESGNVAATANGFVIATIASGNGSLTGGSVQVVNGLATFQSLSIGGPLGSVTVRFQYGFLAAVISVPVVISAGPPTRLFVRTPPPLSVANNVPMSPQPVVELQDAFGNRSSTTTIVTLTTDAVSGSITNATALAQNGIATFSGLTLSGPLGARDYVFRSPGLTPSGTYRITISP